MALRDPLVSPVQRGPVNGAPDDRAALGQEGPQRAMAGRAGPAASGAGAGRKLRREMIREAAAVVTREEQAAAIERFAATLPHRFAKPALLAEALTHRSAADPSLKLLDSNERLEFLGDRVLALVMAEWLAERFPQEREGALGKRLGHLVSAESLARIAERMQLADAVRIPPSERRAGLGTSANLLADALEALLGALYADGGLEPARALVRREWAAMIEEGDRPPASAKTRLQEWLQGRGFDLPEYRVVSTEGPPHSPVFTVRVLAAGRHAEGSSDTKRGAEQAAAAVLLATLESS